MTFGQPESDRLVRHVEVEVRRLTTQQRLQQTACVGHVIRAWVCRVVIVIQRRIVVLQIRTRQIRWTVRIRVVIRVNAVQLIDLILQLILTLTNTCIVLSHHALVVEILRVVIRVVLRAIRIL